LFSSQRKDSFGFVPENGFEWLLWWNSLQRKKHAAVTANKCCVSSVPEHQCRESPHCGRSPFDLALILYAAAAKVGSEPRVTNAAARINGGFRKHSGRSLIVYNANL
jgi:hypothetical protein